MMALLHTEKIALENMALNVRRRIIRLAANGGCFLGAALSSTDLLVYLYKKFLRLEGSNLSDPGRDYLFLSKGHDVPALYAVFVELGWLPSARLQNHLTVNDSIYWHPNRDVPGVEFHSGSLGHLLAVAAGVALDCKMRGQKNKIVVLLGDGELNEGSIWEACLVAQAYQLDNLIAIVDRNHFQANLPTEELIPLEPLAEKFRAFGWQAQSIDGHDFVNMHKLFSNLETAIRKPTAIIAETVRGKGLPSLENRADRWFCNFTPQEIQALLRELSGEEIRELSSEALVPR